MLDEDEIQDAIRELLYEHLDAYTAKQIDNWLMKRAAFYLAAVEVGLADEDDPPAKKKSAKKKAKKAKKKKAAKKH